jgi:hypothetical protein
LAVQEQVKPIIDGLIAKDIVVIPKFLGSNCRKKARNRSIVPRKPLLFSELLLEGRKKQFQNAYKEPHEVVFIDRNSDVLAYMHYIGDSYPASLICLSRTHLLKNFHFTTWEEIYISDRTV